MEARRSLKEQELFYALLEGKHAAMDDAAATDPRDYSYNDMLRIFRYNDKVLVNFMKGYHDASRDLSR